MFCSDAVANVCVSCFDRHAFFGLDRLVQTVAPLSSFHQTTGELVDDDDLAIFDDVVDVSFVQEVCLERIVDQMRPFHVASRVEALHTGKLLGLTNSFVGQRHVVLFFIDREVQSPWSADWRSRSASWYRPKSRSAGPLMINGVRASSIKMLSTSSMMA